MVRMYIVTNTTIFLVVRLLLLRYNYMFRPSMFAIFRLYMRNLSICYTNMCGEFTVCGWGGGCEISFCVGERGMDWGCFGDCVKPLMSTYSYVYQWVTFFDMYNVYWKNYIIYGLSSKVLLYYIHSFT